MPGSAGKQTEPAEGTTAGPGAPGTPGEDLTPHNLDSDAPSIAPATEAPADTTDGETSA